VLCVFPARAQQSGIERHNLNPAAERGSFAGGAARGEKRPMIALNCPSESPDFVGDSPFGAIEALRRPGDAALEKGAQNAGELEI
jgi:hypothetical protein